MIKLVPAKCPSCGANIEVNGKLEKTICQYCGVTVFIDEAIKKYKVEVSGNVKTSSVKDDSEQIEIARKYLKIGKITEANNILKKILDNNPFNFDALCISIDIKLEFIKENLDIDGKMKKRYDKIEKDSGKDVREFFEKDDKENEEQFVKAARKDYKEILSIKDTIKKLDENKEYKKYLENLEKELSAVVAVLDEAEARVNKQKSDSKALIEKCEKYIYYNADNRYAYVLKKVRRLVKAFKMNKKLVGSLPMDLSSFKIKNITETKMELAYYTKYTGHYESEVPVSLEEKMIIVDNFLKKQKRINLIMTALLIGVPVVLLLSGHWFVAILVFLAVLALVNTVIVM